MILAWTSCSCTRCHWMPPYGRPSCGTSPTTWSRRRCTRLATRWAHGRRLFWISSVPATTWSSGTPLGAPAPLNSHTSTAAAFVGLCSLEQRPGLVQSRPTATRRFDCSARRGSTPHGGAIGRRCSLPARTRRWSRKPTPSQSGSTLSITSTASERSTTARTEPPSVAELDIPVTIVRGSHDRIPKDAPELARALPHGRYIEAMGAGHYVPVETPSAFARPCALPSPLSADGETLARNGSRQRLWPSCRGQVRHARTAGRRPGHRGHPRRRSAASTATSTRLVMPATSTGRRPAT